jgi:hypothetical protein
MLADLIIIKSASLYLSVKLGLTCWGIRRDLEKVREGKSYGQVQDIVISTIVRFMIFRGWAWWLMLSS